MKNAYFENVFNVIRETIYSYTGCPRKNAPFSSNTKDLYEIIYYKSKYIEAGRLTQRQVLFSQR